MSKRTVLITGAAGGIGSHLSEVYAEKGHRVVMTDTDEDKGLYVRDGIQGRLKEAELYFAAADLRVPGDILHLMSSTAGQYGTIDVLINNAGFGISKSPYELEVEEWDSVLFTNLRGTFL